MSAHPVAKWTHTRATIFNFPAIMNEARYADMHNGRFSQIQSTVAFSTWIF